MGPDYAHAEARKSPALDGKVERDSEGKEVRYPVILNAREKLIAWKVCLAFKVSTHSGIDIFIFSAFELIIGMGGSLSGHYRVRRILSSSWRKDELWSWGITLFQCYTEELLSHGSK